MLAHIPVWGGLGCGPRQSRGRLPELRESPHIAVCLSSKCGLSQQGGSPACGDSLSNLYLSLYLSPRSLSQLGEVWSSSTQMFTVAQTLFPRLQLWALNEASRQVSCHKVSGGGLGPLLCTFCPYVGWELLFPVLDE